MTKEYFLNKFDNGEEFTFEELEYIIQESDFEYVDEIEGDDHRWNREMQTIIKIDDRLFAIDWRKGLTEMQENEYWDQPYEVKVVEKTIVVKEYVPV